MLFFFFTTLSSRRFYHHKMMNVTSAGLRLLLRTFSKVDWIRKIWHHFYLFTSHSSLTQTRSVQRACPDHVGPIMLCTVYLQVCEQEWAWLRGCFVSTLCWGPLHYWYAIWLPAINKSLSNWKLLNQDLTAVLIGQWLLNSWFFLVFRAFQSTPG